MMYDGLVGVMHSIAKGKSQLGSLKGVDDSRARD